MPPKQNRKPARKGKGRKDLPIGTRQCRVPFDPPKINVVTTQRLWIRVPHNETAQYPDPFLHTTIIPYLPLGTIAYRFMRTRVWSQTPLLKVTNIQPDLASFTDVGTEIHYPKVAWEWGRDVSEKWFPYATPATGALAILDHGTATAGFAYTVDHLLTIKIQINHEPPLLYKNKRMEEKIRSDLAAIELIEALKGKKREEKEERRPVPVNTFDFETDSEEEYYEPRRPILPPPGWIFHADWHNRGPTCLCTQRGAPECEHENLLRGDRPCKVKESVPKGTKPRETHKSKTIAAAKELAREARANDAKRILEEEVEQMKRLRQLRMKPPEQPKLTKIVYDPSDPYGNGYRPSMPDSHEIIPL